MKLSTLFSLSLSLVSVLATPVADYDRDGYKDGIVTAYLSDVHSIRQIINRYALVIDSKNFDQLDALFTADSTWTSPSYGTIKGVKALVDLTRQSTGNASTQHIFANDVLDVDTRKGTATGTVYLLETVYGLTSPTSTLVINGYFKDVFERTRKGKTYPQLEWRFKSRDFVPLLPVNLKGR